MTPSRDEQSEVLELFSNTIDLARTSGIHLIEGGFSGAQVWRVRGIGRDWALRRWPVGYDPERLKWIHQVLFGLPSSLPVPIPLQTNDGRTIVNRRDFLWTLEPWMPGESNYWREPSDEKLIAAVGELAAFHAAVRPWARDRCSIPAIAERVAAVRNHSAAIGDYETAIQRVTGKLGNLCRDIFAVTKDQLPHWQRALSDVQDTQTDLIPCIRDLWHDHVLYTGNQVTGLVDFGGMRLDSIATDLARLVGSLAGSDPRAWRIALDEYRKVASLPDSEARLVPLIDGSSQCIAGLNWVRWLLVEHRTFENSDAVLDRLHRIMNRLRSDRIAEIE